MFDVEKFSVNKLAYQTILKGKTEHVVYFIRR